VQMQGLVESEPRLLELGSSSSFPYTLKCLVEAFCELRL
jgi:hypothetical protein